MIHRCPMWGALFLILAGAADVHAHAVQELFAIASSDGQVLRLDVLLDATFGLPEANDPLSPQPRRQWLFTLADSEHEQLRSNSRALLESILSWSVQRAEAAPRPIPFTLTFPDYEFTPPHFPERMSGGAYVTVRLEAPLPDDGQIQIEHRNGQYPYLVIEIENPQTASPHYFVIYPEEGPVGIPFAKKKLDAAVAELAKPHWMDTAGFFLAEGCRHVIPSGWDHILFIAAICLLSLRWRPLLEQSLLFTLAHSITLGLAVWGGFRLWPHAIEAIIAFSIFWMAVENLWATRVKLSRMTMIFVFGLIHGLGFARVLGDRIQEADRFLAALFMTNLGVELAQVAVIIIVLLVFRLSIPTARAPAAQKCVSAGIAIGAGALLIHRL